MVGRKKNIYLAVSVLFIGLLIMVGTFSYWTWISNENKNIVFNTAKGLADYIIYDSGESKFVGDFKVGNSYTEGVHTTVSIYKKEEASKAMLYATIYMKVNSIGSNLSNTKGLKWVITEGDSTNILADGNFVGTKEKDEFIILPSIEVTTTKKEYTVWIWLDSKYATVDMSGESLDTIVWTQVDQVIEDSFEITRLSNNYQIINATVVNATKNIVSYAITNSNTEPSDWVNITDEEQNRIYTLEYAVNSTGTYYVWFKDEGNKIVSKSINVDSIDTTGPVCTFDGFNPLTIKNGETSSINLTCIDNIGLIGTSDITKDDLVLLSNIASIDKIEKESIDNGYKYTITLVANDYKGNVTMKLNNNVLINRLGNGNDEVISNVLNIVSTYNIIYKDVGDTEFSGIHGTNAPITYEFGEETNLVNPTKSGYTFKGWYVTQDGSGTVITKISSTQTEDIVLYAKWIDDIAPTGSLSLSLNGAVITANVTASDDGSGIKDYGYLIQTNSTCPSNGYTINTNNIYNLNVTLSGTYYVCTKINDNAGNSEIVSSSIEFVNYLHVATSIYSDSGGNTPINFITTVNDDIAETAIKTITFMENNTVPTNESRTLVGSFDVSETGNGSIMAYYYETDTVGMYDFYLGSVDGIIYANPNSESAFGNLKKITSINNMEYFDTSRVTNMRSMYDGCSSLTILNVSNFDTSKVINMSRMFFKCSNLTTIDVSNFNTSKVTNMSRMFGGNDGNNPVYMKLTSITGLNNFDTSNVINTYAMFLNCSSLTTLDISHFDTSNVTNMSFMFSGCSSLTTLDVSNFNTSKVTDMKSMFSYCSSLITLDVTNFDTSNVINMNSMFYNCSSLTTLDVSNFDTSNVTSMRVMFYNCSSLTTLDVSNFDTSKVTDMKSMFSYCSSLTTLDVSNFDTSNVINMSVMFSDCSKLTTLDVSHFDTSKVTNMSYMFFKCSNLTTIDVSNFNTSKVTDMSLMFGGNGGNNPVYMKLTSITGLNNFDTSNVINMYAMFLNCSSLTTLDVSHFDTSKVTDMRFMFYYCSSLITLDISNFDTSNVINMSAMFYNCSSLTTLDVSNFDTSKVTDMSFMFYNCSSLITLDVSDFDTSNVINMYAMFYNCSSLTTLDVSNFDTSKVTDMSYMFNSCSKLTSLNIKGFTFDSVTSYGGMFYSVPTTVKITVGSGTAKTWLNTNFSSYTNIVIG